jgi:hypothetical protein
MSLKYDEVAIALYCLTSMNNVEVDESIFAII